MLQGDETISRGARMISAISVKDRLKNRAVASGKTFQETLTTYGLERTIYRLSVSEYVEYFTLKGIVRGGCVKGEESP